MAGMLRLLGQADARWRQGTADWLPRDFAPEALPRLFLTCNNVSGGLGNSLGPGSSASDPGSPGDTSHGSRSSSLSISIRDSNSSRGLGLGFERSTSANSVDRELARGMRSPPGVSSLSSSHNMASVRKIYSKANYQRFHSKMRLAGGRIADLQENLAKQVLEFSLHSEGDRDRDSDAFSEAGSSRGGGGGPLGFLSDTPAKSNSVKRKITIPKLEAFVTSLTYCPPVSQTPQNPPRPSSISSVVGAMSSLGSTGDSAGHESGSLPRQQQQSAAGSGAAGQQDNTSNLSDSIFSAFANSVVTPSVITSRVLGTPELAAAAMLAAGLADEAGTPLLGALTPATNCVSRSWLGGSKQGSAVSLDKLKPLQEGCIRRLEKFCDEVPPSCPVYMGGLPVLVSMTPLPLPPSQRPRPILRPSPARPPSAAAESASSALYYDPFMAKRDKKLKESSRGPLEVVWVQGSACKVRVCFTNPLCVPMLLSNVALMLQEEAEPAAEGAGTGTGAETPGGGGGGGGEKCYEVTPESVQVPSATDGGGCFYAVLSAMPIRPCRLRLTGIRFFVRNAMYVSLIGEDGQGVQKR
jgi:hypothetical protein